MKVLSEAELMQAAADIAALERARDRHPELWYQPGKPGTPDELNGQLRAHQSEHIVRLLIPGNGFGKTHVMGEEASFWVKHNHPYRQTPRHPVLVLWVCEMLSQFKFVYEGTLKPKCWGSTGYKVVLSNNGVPTEFIWPHGDRIKVFSSENAWESIQGIPVDLVLFDEQPPLALYRELRRRRRTDRKTEYMIAATATKGNSWMETELYRPWLEHHRKLGLTVEQAKIAQKHPKIFCWPGGSIADNPAADQEDIEDYKSQTWSSDAEKKVRDEGGFADFNGMPVFNQAKLQAMLERTRRVESRSLVLN